MRFSDAGAALIAVATLLAAVPSRATEEDAKTFFAEGRRLRLAGDCQNAIVAFKRALEVYPEGLGSLRNIAECEEQLGQFASARNDWWALRRATMQSNEAKYAGWDKDAEAGYNRLENKVAKLTVKVEGKDLERVRVAVDGKPLDPRLYGVPLERDLGAHTIEATYGGVSPIVEKRTLAQGGNEVVTVRIPASTGLAPKADVAAPPRDEGQALRVGGFVAAGIGAAGLIGAGISLALRQSALSEIATKCPKYETEPCSSTLQSVHDRGQTASLLVDVFGGVGIVGAGVGAGLLIAGYRAKHPSDTTSTTTRLSFAPLPGGGFASGEMRF